NNFDEDKSLRLTMTRSLNELSRGESFRDIGGALFEPINTLLSPFNFVCKLIGVGFNISLGSLGFGGSDFDDTTRDITQPGGCGDKGKTKCDADQIVQNKRLYQHDFAGIVFNACLFKIEIGHHSDDDYNVGGSKAATIPGNPPHIFDDPISFEGPDGRHDLE